MSIALLDGEKVFKKTCPFFLSMTHLYISWLYIGCVGWFAIEYNNKIMEWIRTLPFGKSGDTAVYFVLWSLAIIIPAVSTAFIRINWKWLFLGIFLCIIGIGSFIYRTEIAVQLSAFTMKFPFILKFCNLVKTYWPFSRPINEAFHINEIANYWLMIVSAIGIILSNSYRRSHRYYITNTRIICKFGSFIVRERDLMYSKIDDLIVHQDFLGKIFKYGTLIPLSASGIGTGSDQVFLAAGAEKKLPFGPSVKITLGGGRSVTVPRAPSFYSLYGVSRPEILKNIMLKEMDKREYGYTRRQDEKKKRRNR